MSGKHFAQIPVEVLTSEACRTLPHYAKVVLLTVAAQYRGNNNGDIALSYSTARTFGITSKWQLTDSLALLLERGLIQKTLQGGKKPLRPCLYALTWQPINNLAGKIEACQTFAPSNDWVKWSSGLPADQSAINQQHPRRGTSAPPEFPKRGVSEPPEGRTPPIIGTSGGSPSRSPREGVAVACENVVPIGSRSPRG